MSPLYIFLKRDDPIDLGQGSVGTHKASLQRLTSPSLEDWALCPTLRSWTLMRTFLWKRWQNWMQVSRQNVHSNSAHNGQKVDRAWIFITGWMDKPSVVHSYNDMLFSHKMEEIHVTTQMILKVMLSEISQALKKTYGMMPFIWNVQMGKSLETESRSVVAEGWGEGLRMAAQWVQGCLLGW